MGTVIVMVIPCTNTDRSRGGTCPRLNGCIIIQSACSRLLLIPLRRIFLVPAIIRRAGRSRIICALTGRGRRVSTFLIPTSCHGKCHSTGYCKRGCLSDFAVKHILPPILYLPQRTRHLCAMSPESYCL